MIFDPFSGMGQRPVDDLMHIPILLRAISADGNQPIVGSSLFLMRLVDLFKAAVACFYWVKALQVIVLAMARLFHSLRNHAGILLRVSSVFTTVLKQGTDHLCVLVGDGYCCAIVATPFPRFLDPFAGRVGFSLIVSHGVV